MDPLTISALIGTGTAAANAIGGQMLTNQSYGRTKNLMGIQQANQMKLNEQGQALQMKTWEQTNYPAQVGMLKAAGLNPALMYAKGGTGGTTGGQGGGSAAMGHAPQAPPMAIGNLLEIASAKAQIELVNAQRKKVEAETPTTGNLGDTGLKKTGAETLNIMADTANKQIQAGILEITRSNTDQEQKSAIFKTIAETKKALAEGTIIEGEAESRIQQAKQAVVRNELEMELTRAKIEMTQTEIEAISVRLAQDAERIMQGATGLEQGATRLAQGQTALEQTDREIAIKKLKQEYEVAYPGAMQVVGNVMDKAYKTLEWMAKIGGAWPSGHAPEPKK
ncbi:MAG: DNA pilot protein [Microviridae sp.]|nr:MAG: DNA pilot protein [Microviridae sp.]